jgi:hypothetical protein
MAHAIEPKLVGGVGGSQPSSSQRMVRSWAMHEDGGGRSRLEREATMEVLGSNYSTASQIIAPAPARCEWKLGKVEGGNELLMEVDGSWRKARHAWRSTPWNLNLFVFSRESRDRPSSF